jgi:hypothetical protein
MSGAIHRCPINQCRYNRVRLYLYENSLFNVKYYSSRHLTSNVENSISTVIRKNILLDFLPLLIVYVNTILEGFFHTLSLQVLTSHFELDRDQSQGRQCASVSRHCIFYVKLNEYYWYQVDRDRNGYQVGRDCNGYPMLQAQVNAMSSATVETLLFKLFPVDPKILMPISRDRYTAMT